MDKWFSVVPFLIAMGVAMATRQVLVGLVLGLLVGSFAVNPGVLSALSQMINYIFTGIDDRENLRIIVFLYVFGGLVGMVEVAGGIKGFARVLKNYTKTARTALLVAWSTVLVTFVDCEFRIMTIGPVMKAVKGKLNVDKSKVAYAIDVSTVPVIVLVPVATTYVGYMVSVVGGALNQAQINRPPYQLFLASIPFNFYAIVIVLIGLLTILTGRYIGRSLGRDAAGMAVHPDENEDHRKSIAEELERVDPRPLHLVLPLALLVFVTFYLIWQDGSSKGAGSFLQAVQKADATQAMLVALFITVIVTVAFFLLHRERLSELMFHFVDGGNQLLMAILLLVVVWAMAAMSKDLGFSQFMTDTVGTFLPREVVPAAIFLFGSAISYFIGSSWGTWGILMPLGVSLAAATGASLPLTVGAVFASGSFGDFTSPLGETTVTTAAVFDLSVVDYAKLKLPSSLAAVGISIILFLVVGFMG